MNGKKIIKKYHLKFWQLYAKYELYWNLKINNEIH